jgi:S1-C subfamily serine protease
MSIEELTKTQIILLTLLVSFVTSIATGIVTVALLAAAPPAVTQTVNRVIQNTVEKVIPEVGGTNTETIVVKEEDLVVDSIDQNAKSLAAIKIDQNGTPGAVLGTGFLASKEGLVVTDSTGITLGANYEIALGGASYPATALATDPRGFAILKITPIKKDDGRARTFDYSSFGDSGALKIGQTVIALSTLDGDSLNVAKGIISGLVQDAADPKVIANIALTMSLGKANSGSPLLDTNGTVIGLILIKNDVVQVIPANTVSAAVAAIPSV